MIFSILIDLLHINGVYRVDTNIKNDVEIASNEVAIINLSLTMEIKQWLMNGWAFGLNICP